MAKTDTQKWSIAIPKANHSLRVIMLIDNHDQMESVNNSDNFWKKKNAQIK
jgi:predicted MPP superfamily phosphohydrolase